MIRKKTEKKEYTTKNVIETQKMGEKLAAKILETKPQNMAFIIGLQGELGSGKTIFLQGFAKGLGIKEKVLSPTFVIMKKFRIKHPASNIQYLIHIDCYRLKGPKDLLDLGFKKIISDPKNIVVIEWADKIKKILPKNSFILQFYFVSQKRRRITSFFNLPSEK